MAKCTPCKSRTEWVAEKVYLVGIGNWIYLCNFNAEFRCAADKCSHIFDMFFFFKLNRQIWNVWILMHDERIG